MGFRITEMSLHCDMYCENTLRSSSRIFFLKDSTSVLCTNC